MRIVGQLKEGPVKDLQLHDDGSLWISERLCVSDIDEIKREIMTEAHSSLLSSIREPQRCIKISKKLLVERHEALDYRVCREMPYLSAG